MNTKLFSQSLGAKLYDNTLPANLISSHRSMLQNLRLLTCSTHLWFISTILLYALPQLMIKKQNGLTGYCFCTQVDISALVRREWEGKAYLSLSSTHIWSTRQNGSIVSLCILVDSFGLFDKRIILTACQFTPTFSVIKEVAICHLILIL